MGPDLLDLYDRGSAWAVEVVSGAVNDLDATTPCEEWNVRTLLNHMLDAQRYFLSAARGEQASPPGATAPEILSDDPAGDFRKMRTDMLAAYSDPEVRERTGISLGIAFSDLLLHTWDLARATGQDETLDPDKCAEMLEGMLPMDEALRQSGHYGPRVAVPADADVQTRLLAFIGRTP